MKSSFKLVDLDLNQNIHDSVLWLSLPSFFFTTRAKLAGCLKEEPTSMDSTHFDNSSNFLSAMIVFRGFLFRRGSFSGSETQSLKSLFWVLILPWLFVVTITGLRILSCSQNVYLLTYFWSVAWFVFDSFAISGTSWALNAFILAFTIAEE